MKTMYLISNTSDDVDQITVIGETEHDFTIETELGVFVNAKNGIEGYQIFDTEKEAWMEIQLRHFVRWELTHRELNRIKEILKNINKKIKSLEL